MKRPIRMTAALVAMVTSLWGTAALANTMRFDQQMQPVLHAYAKIQQALAADKTTGVAAAARAIVAATNKLDPSTVRGQHAEHYASLPAKLKAAATAVAAAANLAAAREAFKKLSQPMAMWATMSKPAGIDVMFCPMAQASWLQKHGAVKNPYLGSKMLSCGQVVATPHPSH